MNVNEAIAGIAGAVLLSAFAYVDMNQSLGVSAPILYTVVVVVGLLARSRLLVVVFATVAATLTIMGAHAASGAADDLAELINRALAVFAISVTALGSYLLLKRQNEYDVYLRELADRDGLTGVANRRALMEQARTRLAEALRYELPLSVLMIDIDHFKSINDRHGHLVGDAVLQRISRVCASTVRQSDTVGRYGGEEFLVVCPNTPARSAELLAGRLCRAIAAENIAGKTGVLTVTVSIGVASIGAAAGAADIDRLVEAADQALYRAKAGGRNRVVVSDGPPLVYLERARVA